MNLFTEIHELYRYRELLRNLVSRDIKKRYKRSALGFLWVMLDPLLIMLIFYIIFSGIFGKTIANYTAYVISGITMWQLFAQGTKVASLAFLHNRNLINKLYLPKSIFPISVVASSLVHFLFSLIPLFLIIIFSGTNLSPYIILLPIIVSFIFIFALGMSLIISTLAVFFHDVIYIYDVVLMGWMYLSAIFYPVSILPKKFQIFMSLNPLYHYISLFRGCLYDKTMLTIDHVLLGFIFALLSFATGWSIYHKNKERIIFYL
jgi:ABC-type polysaccharide/polyol phosphate export permease